MLELPRSELPIRVVGNAAEGVRPDVRCGADVERHDLDVVRVGQEEELSQLAHHGGGLGGEVREHPDYRMVVLVEQQLSSFKLWREGLNGAADGLELLERDVLLEVGSRPEASGFDAIVEH